MNNDFFNIPILHCHLRQSVQSVTANLAGATITMNVKLGEANPTARQNLNSCNHVDLANLLSSLPHQRVEHETGWLVILEAFVFPFEDQFDFPVTIHIRKLRSFVKVATHPAPPISDPTSWTGRLFNIRRHHGER
ncbi:hypothetical protein [Shumkonia mesophila]|uniref:hypothetical protein n=1 Tax=Shumkonia mesophila TaxID=2838854 RepID=UPI002934484C|nr:hypothetical protein [Shumkonia mesophila]